MHPATRSQVDYDPLENSIDAETHIHDEPITRQEEAANADINNILSKFGIHALQGRQAIQGALVDFTQGLQEAMTIINEVRGAYERLPEHIKKRYRPEDVETAILAGQPLDLTEPLKEGSDNVTQVTEKEEKE